MTQASLLARLEPVQPQIKAASVAAVDSAGILKLKVLYTVNIKMWYHPKYYKELRKLRNKLDQAISHANSTRGPSDVRPDPGPKQQAASDKPQAPSDSNSRPQASSDKQQASSSKPQASSSKI